ncbi:MAG: hypothetical protein ACQXXK_08855, partial [Methanothrix sp.]|uniref:hypothetical protein n=1 Tax=Methanothrix sp. TaxID=90426 RepID=UPI003D287C43
MQDNTSMDDIVIMRVKRRTRYNLSLIGSKAETYDDIIRRLMREAGYPFSSLFIGIRLATNLDVLRAEATNSFSS